MYAIVHFENNLPEDVNWGLGQRSNLEGRHNLKCDYCKINYNWDSNKMIIFFGNYSKLFVIDDVIVPSYLPLAYRRTIYPCLSPWDSQCPLWEEYTSQLLLGMAMWLALANGMWLGSSVYHIRLGALEAIVTFLLLQEWHVPDGGCPFSLGPGIKTCGGEPHLQVHKIWVRSNPGCFEPPTEIWGSLNYSFVRSDKT